MTEGAAPVGRRLYSAVFYCLGYWCKYRKDHTFRATYRLRSNWNLPRSFVIKSSNRADLEHFIDGLYSNSIECREWMEDGRVTEVVYEEPPAVGSVPEIVHVSADRLREIFTAQCPLGIPEGFGIKFTTPGGSSNITVREVAAALVSDKLAAQMEQDKWFVGRRAISEHCTFRWVLHEKSFLPEFVPWTEAMMLIEDSKAPPEHWVVHKDLWHNGVQEVIYTIVRAGVAYFARYLFSDGTPIWMGTGKAASGPWKMVYVDRLRCAAYGIEDVPEAVAC